jgi:antirestriction protein ArdC
MKKEDRKSTYELVTDRILDLLKQGVAPWHKPWKTTCLGGECGAFFNLKTKKPYRGANVWLLAAADFSSPYFISFNQCKSMGGMVRQGEKGTKIIFWKPIKVEDKNSVTGFKVIPMCRGYTVFNVEQCDGLADKLPKKEEEREATDEEKQAVLVEALTEAEAIVEAMPKKPEIRHTGSRACYSPTFDRVTMPDRQDFDGTEEYYSVLFHELGHATGHETRLARKGVTGEEGNWSPFGSPSYAKEELVAEMTAAFICGHLGIENKTINNSAAYLASWEKNLKDDPKMFIHAAGAAQRAADFILGKGSGQDNDKDSTERTEDATERLAEKAQTD